MGEYLYARMNMMPNINNEFQILYLKGNKVIISELRNGDTYLRKIILSSFVRIMVGASSKPLLWAVLIIHQLDQKEQPSVRFESSNKINVIYETSTISSGLNVHELHA